jgi:hypothetical protein
MAISVRMIYFLVAILANQHSRISFSCRQHLAISLAFNLFDCRQSGNQGSPQMHLFSPAGSRIYFFIANLAMYCHYFEHWFLAKGLALKSSWKNAPLCGIVVLSISGTCEGAHCG